MSEIVVFSGSAHPELADEICAHLHVPRQPVAIKRFANDCLEVQLQANCRDRDVYIIQPLVPPVQEHLVELLLMLDAARGASAARITVVMPHFAYARSDKKAAPRISIGARLVADLLATAGASRVLTMTLHSPQVHGFFSVPVDHLHALRELAGHFQRYDLADSVVVSPDLGNAKSAAAFARMLGVPVAAGAKQRIDDDRVTITAVIGEIDDRDVIVLDDEIAKGTTLLELLDRLRERKVALDPGGLHARPVRGRLAGPAQRPGGRPGDRVHQHGADRGAGPVAEAAGALGGAGAGRGDPPHPQRRVGQRAVRLSRRLIVSASRPAAPSAVARNSDGSASSSSSRSGAPSAVGDQVDAGVQQVGRSNGTHDEHPLGGRHLLGGRLPRRDLLRPVQAVDAGVRAGEQRALADRVRVPAADEHQRGLAVLVDGGQVGLHHHEPAGAGQAARVRRRQVAARPGRPGRTGRRRCRRR